MTCETDSDSEAEIYVTEAGLKAARHDLSLETKLKVLAALDKGRKRKDVGEMFRISQSVISRIVRSRSTLESIRDKNKSLKRKRVRKSSSGERNDVREAVTLWFKQKRAMGCAITGAMVMEKATEFGGKMNVSGFRASEGWLSRWKLDENVSFRMFSGEMQDADKESAEEWVKNSLPKLCEGYKPNDIFNADETGLIYKGLPKGTLTIQGDRVEGGKASKDRLTFLLICNMDGSEKHVAVIGKSKRPRCFKRGEMCPLQYYANTRAWMTGNIWTDILKKLDSKIGEQGRKIVMFVDNAPCHKIEQGTVLANITIHFIPANTTCIIQPLDIGIIRSFKAKYLGMITRKRLALIDGGVNPLKIGKEITVKIAIEFGRDAWDLVTGSTIRNCFRKAWGVGSEDSMQVEEEIPQISGPVGDEPPCCGEPTDEDIISEVRGEDEEDDEVDIEPQPPPTKQMAMMSLLQVRKFLESIGADTKIVSALERQFLDTYDEESVQKEIRKLYG
jgi:hypothetical protein